MGAGTRALTVTLVNHTSHSCVLEGRPSVTLLGRGEVALPTTEGAIPTRATATVRMIHLAPSDRTSFRVYMAGRGPTDTPLGACPTLVGLRFTLPPSSGPGATAEARLPKPPADTPPIAAYPGIPGGRCDGVSVSVLLGGSHD